MAKKQGVTGVLEQVKAYARQELLGPLSGAGRWLALGVAGSFAVAVGLILLLLSLLRALQNETGTALSGNLSWIPYLITVAALAVVLALLLSRVKKRGL